LNRKKTKGVEEPGWDENSPCGNGIEKPAGERVVPMRENIKQLKSRQLSSRDRLYGRGEVEEWTVSPSAFTRERKGETTTGLKKRKKLASGGGEGRGTRKKNKLQVPGGKSDNVRSGTVEGKKENW